MCGVISLCYRDQILLICDDQGKVFAYSNTEDAAEAYCEMQGTNQRNDNGLVACVAMIMTHPRIHEVDELQDLLEGIVTLPATVAKLQAPHGQVWGIRCTGKNAKAWHESGETIDRILMRSELNASYH